LSEKISFDEKKDAAIEFVTPISVLINVGKGLEKDKNKQETISSLLSIMAPITDERCSYDAMIEYVTIRKLKGSVKIIVN
jgi:hypothetical protein